MGHPTAPATQRVSVVGSHYSELSRAAVQAYLLDCALRSIPGYVCVANVHTTMTGFFRAEYRAVTNEALLAIPDGMPLVWAMRSLGAGGQDRVRGPTLMRDLFDKGRALAIKHYLYGGSPAALAALRAALEKDYPDAEIVGAESPPFRPLEEISEREWSETAERINRSGAQLVWVGLGAPKQEVWMWHQRGRIRGVMLGVGAAFDLLSGRIPEAPPALQRLGLEWAYRLFREPSRLWRRYLFNNPAFLLLWGGQLLAHTFGKRYKISQL